MLCQKCGTTNPIDSNFCSKCGQELKSNGVLQEQSDISPKLKQEDCSLMQQKKGLGCWTYFLIAVVLLIGSCALIDENDDRKQYQNSIALIKDQKYRNAAVSLVGLKEKKYQNAQILYEYANAEDVKNSDPSMTEFYLKDIPNNYSGEFADEIKTLRELVKEKANQQRQKKIENAKEREKERESQIYIGDSQYKVIKVFGEPLRKNRTVVGNVAREQWVYNNYYIYIENGIVTAFQD